MSTTLGKLTDYYKKNEPELAPQLKDKYTLSRVSLGLFGGGGSAFLTGLISTVILVAYIGLISQMPIFANTTSFTGLVKYAFTVGHNIILIVESSLLAGGALTLAASGICHYKARQIQISQDDAEKMIKELKGENYQKMPEDSFYHVEFKRLTN